MDHSGGAGNYKRMEIPERVHTMELEGMIGTDGVTGSAGSVRLVSDGVI